MRKLFQSLCLIFAGSSEKELARQIQFLKVENEILRGKLPKRIKVTAGERQRLVKFGKGLGSTIRQLISIVSPRTFFRWINGEKTPSKSVIKKPGRPKKPEDVRELVLRIARETGWGYTRILGELRKLGIHDVCRSTVVNILKENGLDPGPKRGEGTWHEFIKRHAETLWATDFFSKRVWTISGLVKVYVLFFIHVGTRRVHVAGMTTNPDNAWMVQKAREMTALFAEQPVPPKYLVLDNDTKFTKSFEAILTDKEITPVHTAPCAANMNAIAERFVLSIKSECLDHFVVIGEDHLRHLVDSYLAHYHEERPHQGLGNRPLSRAKAHNVPVLVACSRDVVCEERLGGLLKHYRRAA